MDSSQILVQVKREIDTAQEQFANDLKKIRTGRANPAILDGLMVEAYGTTVPLLQVGSISVPEAQMLQVSPFDPQNLSAITAAIRDNQSLGLNPMDDGRVVRVPLPPLTTERRQQVVKQLHQKVEETMIRFRQARHDGLKKAERIKKDKDMGEDDYIRLQKQIDQYMSAAREKVEGLSQSKETEIMTV